MLRRKTIPWPPKPYERPKGRHQMIAGEPVILDLTRFPNDTTLRGHEWMVCCACKFRHLFAYEVVNAPDGWCLKVRAYADGRTVPKKRRRSKRKK